MSFIFGGGDSSGGGGGASSGTQVSIAREAPEVEARKLSLYDQALKLAQSPVPLPAYQVAGPPPNMQAGFNLAEAMGISNKELTDLIADKKVGFEDVRDAFESVTSEGGKFSGLMDELSKTTPGQLSNLSDLLHLVSLDLHPMHPL